MEVKTIDKATIAFTKAAMEMRKKCGRYFVVNKGCRFNPSVKRAVKEWTADGDDFCELEGGMIIKRKE